MLKKILSLGVLVALLFGVSFVEARKGKGAHDGMRMKNHEKMKERRKDISEKKSGRTQEEKQAALQKQHDRQLKKIEAQKEKRLAHCKDNQKCINRVNRIYDKQTTQAEKKYKQRSRGIANTKSR